MFQTIRMFTGKSKVKELLTKHFQGFQLTTLVTAARRFPSASRIDAPVALDDFLQRYPSRLLGMHSGFGHETVSLAHLLTRGSPLPIDIGPLQHDEVGREPDPDRCLKTGLWVSLAENLPFAVLLRPVQVESTRQSNSLCLMQTAERSWFGFTRVRCQCPMMWWGAIVQKTKGTSAAFIKELMRRSAQFEFEIDGNDVLHHRSVHAALEEMLLVGGSLTKLLGAEGADIVGGSGTSSSDSTFVITSRLHSSHEI